MTNAAKIFMLLMTAVALFMACDDDESSNDNPMTPTATGATTALIGRGEERSFADENGIEVQISPGTVPNTSDGTPGQIVFSIEPAAVTAPNPAGATLVSEPVEIGPEGFTFGQKVRISIPLPDSSDTDANEYLMGRLDRGPNMWRFVPTIVVEGQPDRRSADVSHLSIWALFGLPRDPQGPGRIRFTNTDATRWVSACVSEFTLAFPERDALWDADAVGTSLSNAGHTLGVTSTADVIAPQGTWTFQAGRTEVIAPMMTAGPDGWITLEPVTVDMPNVVGPTITLNPSSWTEVNMVPIYPPCDGEPDVAAGTGTIQVTLTWELAVDLDLQVIEPGGEQIDFRNRESATGGQLDQDNICLPTSGSGQPENIFWGSTAPRGDFTVRVNLFGRCGVTDPTIAFRVRTVVDGNVQTFNRTISGVGETVTITTFRR